MEIRVNNRGTLCDVIVKSGNTNILEDVVCGNKIEDGLIEQMFTSAFELSRFDNISDVDTIRTLIDNFLNESELNELKKSFVKEV